MIDSWDSLLIGWEGVGAGPDCSDCNWRQKLKMAAWHTSSIFTYWTASFLFPHVSLLKVFFKKQTFYSWTGIYVSRRNQWAPG